MRSCGTIERISSMETLYTFDTVVKQIQEHSSLRPTPSQDDSLYEKFISIKNAIPYQGYEAMCIFVKEYLPSLLTTAVEKHPKSLLMITDVDFLAAMDISAIKLDPDYCIRFNRLYRSYVINPGQNVIYNPAAAEIMYRIAYRQNREFICKLIGVGVPEQTAVWLAVNRYCSTDDQRNIRKMVRAIQHLDPEVMPKEFIKNIFDTTFGQQWNLYNLLKAIMTDRFDSFDDDNEELMYDRVTEAVLELIEETDIRMIRDIIDRLAMDESHSGLGTIERIDFETISPIKYPKIYRCVNTIYDDY